MLVSFCVKCYNQKEYIADALQAAFAQTYRPLEIVVSDDASSDGSVDVIEKCIAEYRKNGGDVPIVFVRNERNLGNVGNWQRLCEAARGDVLVKADGDDVSHPNRVERILANWTADVMCLVHAADTIDEAGRKMGTFEKADGCFGAASAYARETFTKFGPVSHMAAADDEVYLVRAKMLGRVKQIGERLVDYRIGSGFSSIRKDFRNRMHLNYIRTWESRKQSILDGQFLGVDAAVRERLVRAERAERAMVVLWSAEPIWRRWSAYLHCSHGRIGSKVWAVRLLQLLPRALSDSLVNALASIRHHRV